MKKIEATDTCHRCGLRRATRELEEQGISIHLCDDCYWGQESDSARESEQKKNPPAA